MDSYSHGPFEVSGYKVTIENPEAEGETIMAAWQSFFADDFSGRITDKVYQNVHAVYYNYHDQHDLSRKGYDMLIGYNTTDSVVQGDSTITTLKIPAQDYRYIKTTDITPAGIFGAWSTINHTPQGELARSYGYDLDMYSEDHTELTIAVSVNDNILS